MSSFLVQPPAFALPRHRDYTSVVESRPERYRFMGAPSCGLGSNLSIFKYFSHLAIQTYFYLFEMIMNRLKLVGIGRLNDYF